MKPALLFCLRIRSGSLALVLLGILLLPAAVSAEVVKVEITSREVISDLPELIHTGPYEIIKGIISLEVDPDDPANQSIVDLKLAPRNSRGRVEFSTDFGLHKPADAKRGNRRLMYFVNNRGHRMGHLHFNYEAGKNWLYGRGYSYLWSGWNCDVIESDDALNIRVPVITENGRTVTGRIYSEIISFSDDMTYSQPLVWGDSVSYPPVTDENKRMVFDGVMAHCAGAGKGQFNSRFAQFTRHGSHHEDNLYPIDFFPLATVEQLDPVTGEKGNGFAEARKWGFLPKMMFINSSTDYWTRAASLLHTDVEGRKDIEIDRNVRIYAIAGIAHTESRIGIVGRALLTALDEWVSLGIAPPESQVPMISDGTLVTLEGFKKNFPRIPNVIMPG